MEAKYPQINEKGIDLNMAVIWKGASEERLKDRSEVVEALAQLPDADASDAQPLRELQAVSDRLERREVGDPVVAKMVH